mmetsp:Transcript_11896/g.25751  ORF Transcript_11896/g.25751 Transcript_11896/m.25751 type:complete len:280 (+) Transcript_11896:197-1036(+)
MRRDDWELQITVDGRPLDEYAVEGHTVVMAQPGKRFFVEVAYLGIEDQGFFVQILIDGKKTDAWVALDPTGRTASESSVTFDGWMKSEGKHEACSAFLFEVAHADDKADDSCSFGTGGTDWSRGVVELRIAKATFEVAEHDVPWPSLYCDKAATPGLTERELVKGGLSASVGRGETAFHECTSEIMIPAGQEMLQCDPEAAVQSYRLYYRDDFFLAVHGHVNFTDAREAKWQKGRGKATVRRMKDLREKMQRIKETEAKLKRQKGASRVEIDLTCSDDE